MHNANRRNARRQFLKAAAVAATGSLWGASPSLTVAPAATGASPLPAVGLAGTAGNGRVVLITGTSSGFGRLMALTFARNGWTTLATMRNTQARNAADECSCSGKVTHCKSFPRRQCTIYSAPYFPHRAARRTLGRPPFCHY